MWHTQLRRANSTLSNLNELQLGLASPDRTFVAPQFPAVSVLGRWRRRARQAAGGMIRMDAQSPDRSRLWLLWDPLLISHNDLAGALLWVILRGASGTPIGAR